jgi:signal transduction histidine kinase
MHLALKASNSSYNTSIMEPVIVANWKHWRSWAWLFFVFSLFQGYELLQWTAASTRSLTPYFIGREYVEIYAIAILVPFFWSIARRVHYLNTSWWIWIPTQIASVLIFSIGYIYVFRFGMALWLMTQQNPTPWRIFSIDWSNVQFISGVFNFVLILAAYYGLDAYKRWRHREAVAARLQTQLVEARLQALQSQLQPHFLFNALQTIAALIHTAPDKAERMLERLGDLLRLVLDHDDSVFVPLQQELNIVETYLQIQKERFGERLLWDVEIAPDMMGVTVPTLILQPLVENAIKHGTASGQGKLTIGALRDGEKIRIWVKDQGAGPEPSPILGHGLSNIRKRLESVYGTAGQLRLDTGNQGGAVATIEMPWRDTPIPQPG